MHSAQNAGTSSRRNLLRIASGTGLLLFSDSLIFAADFWNKKDADSWSAEEIEQMKSKSPWARKVHAEMAGGGGGARGGGGGGAESMDSSGSKGSFGGITGADSNGISAGGGGGRGGGGGGRGGRGGEGGGGGGFAAPALDVVVRWESAAPVLHATRVKLPPDLTEHYALSVTGLPPQMLATMLTGGGRGRGQGRNGREGAPPAEAQPQEDPAARQKAAIERLMHSASLSAKGHDPVTADLVRQMNGNQTLVFGFPKQALPLAAADKDVQFIMKLGALTIKAKFEPKEMMYKGELAI